MGPLYQGLIWFIPSMIILVVISIFVFDEDDKIDICSLKISSLKSSLWKSRGPIFLMVLVALALQIENLLQDLFRPGFRITEIIYDLEGVSHIVWLQENLNHQFLIHFSSIFYILGLSFFLTFIPVFFILRDERDIIDEFAKALAVNYMFLIPGYLIFHLVVTSFHSPDVEALMYDYEQYYAIIQATNRPYNCIPSGHTSIPLTITLIAGLRAKLKRLTVFGIIFTALTIFVIIYLGVHWLIDIPTGMAVAFIAYWVSSRNKLDFIFDKIIDTFEKYSAKFLNKYM